MPREIAMHVFIGVPEDDGRSTPEIVAAVEEKLRSISREKWWAAHKRVEKLTFEVVLAEVTSLGEPIVNYTVHPFDDEWVWDAKTSGSHPWTTPSLQAAIDHANLVRLEYASVDGVDPDWIANFWSAIYGEGEDEPMIGWVDPAGNFSSGSDPPIDKESGDWKGEE